MIVSMPRPDLSGPARTFSGYLADDRNWWHYLAFVTAHTRRRRGPEPSAEPVEPPRPRPLSGGAEAPLDFGE